MSQVIEIDELDAGQCLAAFGHLRATRESAERDILLLCAGMELDARCQDILAVLVAADDIPGLDASPAGALTDADVTTSSRHDAGAITTPGSVPAEARTEPSPRRPPGSWWRWRWLIPLPAAAMAAALYFAVRPMPEPAGLEPSMPDMAARD